MKEKPVGIFDSGVGGLSVWKELIKILPAEEYIYYSDGAYCPYGPKGDEEIIKRAGFIAGFLLNRGVKLIVVACNTATAAAIDTLRFKYPDIPIIGMEPAVKPAAIHSRSGIIGVLATAGTFKGRLYNQTLERFASEVKVIERIGDGLVELVEKGETNSPEAEALLRKYIEPMLEEGADHIVLGCTHYPFLEKLIKKIAGNDVFIDNPAPSVAKHTFNTLIKKDLLNTANHEAVSVNTYFYSSGDVLTLKYLAGLILKDIPDDHFNNLIINS
jgi:glutamate racemase